MKKLRKYKPIKVHHIVFGYGWWFGEHVYFIKRGNGFAIIPLFYICKDCIYDSNGNIVGNGDSTSWSENRQRESVKGRN